MSAMTLRRALRRSRRRLVVALAVVGLAGAVAAHHGWPMDTHGMPAAALCLAIATAAGAAVAVGAGAAVWFRVWSGPIDGGPRPSWRSIRHHSPARAGPSFARLQVLRR
jgi:peptidoglycan/LPS O-acetylase OafA/YrhL